MSKHQSLDLGLVVASHGRHVIVETPERRRILCHPRGKKSEVVVGDQVRWQSAGDEGVVEAIEERRNLMFRQDEWRTKSFAANLDQIMILVAGEPVFSESQLTRALIAAEQAQIKAVIGLNKIDLPATNAARERLRPYLAMGVEVIELGLRHQQTESKATLLEHLHGRTTLVLGPSGTGKSTLINLMVPRAMAEIGEISTALNSGRHTTTTTRWYWLGETDGEGALIDSPGFQEFGLRQVAAIELAALMPDFRPHLGGCRFSNCVHLREPGCAVIESLDRGEISPHRYRLYGELFAELSTKRW